MKQSELESELAGYLRLMGVSVGSPELELLARHITLVLEANRRVNLTRITDPIDAVRRHTADSLAILTDVGQGPEGTLLDLGSGAGFPGIPLAICSTRRVLLLDSVGKKARELSLLIGELGLADRVTSEARRAEALGRDAPGEFAVVTARAVAELAALVELASPLVVSGGLLVCMKGSPDPIEVSRADEVARLVGMRLESKRSYDLPLAVGHRTVLVYRKSGVPTVTLPRREGLAQHAPLA